MQNESTASDIGFVQAMNFFCNSYEYRPFFTLSERETEEHSQTALLLEDEYISTKSWAYSTASPFCYLQAAKDPMLRRMICYQLGFKLAQERVIDSLNSTIRLLSATVDLTT